MLIRVYHKTLIISIIAAFLSQPIHIDIFSWFKKAPPEHRCPCPNPPKYIRVPD